MHKYCLKRNTHKTYNEGKIGTGWHVVKVLFGLDRETKDLKSLIHIKQAVLSELFIMLCQVTQNVQVILPVSAVYFTEPEVFIMAKS